MTPVTSEVSPAVSSAFTQALAEEHTLIEQFVEALKREQSSLSSGQTDDLPAHTEEKTRIAARLNELSAQRTARLSAHGFRTDRNGVEAWCDLYPEGGTAVDRWSGILALAADARELNRVNGDLIRLRMQYNAKALEALQGGKTVLDLYGPDGQSKSHNSGRINDAV